MVELIVVAALCFLIGMSIGVVIGIKRGQSVVLAVDALRAPTDAYLTTTVGTPHPHHPAHVFGGPAFDETDTTASYRCVVTPCQRIKTIHKEGF